MNRERVMHRKLQFILYIILMILELPVFAQKAYRIHDLNFSGNNTLQNEELLEQFNTIPRDKLNRLLFWKKNPPFLQDVFKNDIQRLKSYYIRNGFLNAHINYVLDTLKSKDQINIHVFIDEKEFVMVDSVKFYGSLDSLSYAMIDSVQNDIPLKPKQRFRDEDVFKSENILLQYFTDAGYPFVQSNYLLSIDRQKKNASINFKVDPGKRSFFGAITIRGDSLISESFIEKRVLLSKSDLYSQQRISATQQNIFETQLFQYVIINALKDSIVDNRIPIDVFVKELPRYTFEGGVGYGTEDRLRLSGR